MQLRGKALRSTRQLGTGQKNGGQGGGGVQIDWGDGGNQGNRCGPAPQSAQENGESPRERLAEASAEVITALRAAKEELAKELEANLKQLKDVLKETERIQRDMEAVLKETQCSPSLHEKAKGDAGPEKPKERHEGDEKREAQGQERPQEDAQKQGQDRGQGDKGQQAQGQGQAQSGQDQAQQGNGQGGQPSPWQARKEQADQPPQTGGQSQGGNQRQGNSQGQGATQAQGGNQSGGGQASDGRRFRRRPITPWSQIGTGRSAGQAPSWDPQIGPKGAPQSWQPPEQYAQQSGPGS